MDEPGRTSVTPQWREQAGRERTSALLAAARDGDEAAWSDLLAMVEPFLTTLVRGAGIDPPTGESIAADVPARLRREVHRIDDEDSLIAWVLRAVREYPAGRYSEVDRTLSSLSVTERHLLLVILRGGSGYADVARYTEIPAGAIGPTRARLFKKIWRLSTSGVPGPRRGRRTARDDLEAALLLRKAAREEAPPEPRRGWVRALARAFGLVPPPRHHPATDVVAACRDVTGATRDVLGEFALVVSEHAALAPEAGDRR
ncbi:hypothetical protein MUY14_00795 [Amycolatopsis sp. FBCC-B4732]|uniref:hypothetical protein n=1 Tax=Amycolatopsis sp. FBCC-B4732 TaxID=3079339 RepID=UPI001FF2BE02|nr:hypothetical protein [Amycolatopsis sp. FBCC-B4732]UOX89217.1 hypothetical protein MUY14_00795 [Amycolatopsis sp. FBCC-B4732]